MSSWSSVVSVFSVITSTDSSASAASLFTVVSLVSIVTSTAASSASATSTTASPSSGSTSTITASVTVTVFGSSVLSLLVALESIFELFLVDLGVWQWLHVTSGGLELVTLGQGEHALKGGDDSLGGDLVKSLNHWLVLVDELLAQDLVLDVEALDVSLEVLDDLDGVADGSTSGIKVDEILLLLQKLLAGVGSVAKRSASDSDSDLIGLGGFSLLQNLFVLADRIVSCHVLLFVMLVDIVGVPDLIKEKCSTNRQKD